MNNERLKSNLTSSKHWLRLVFMLLFAAVLQLASLVMYKLVKPPSLRRLRKIPQNK
jgi:hypothetical protein